jgi:hypothetical protein
MGEIDGYIETVDERRKSISQVISSLREFVRTPPRNSFSAMLIAKPGSGKSFFVSRLAATLGLPHLSFNITQLVSRESLNLCFDAVSSAQAQDRNNTHLLFFDEINAEIGGVNVYDLFLTALEEGTYLRGGRPFKLDPCAWIFAGTEELDPRAYANKEADFRSRLTLQSVNLKYMGDDTDERRSLIYQGALQLQLQHTDVKKISAEVLKAFACLPLEEADTNSRKVRLLAGQFRNIQYGEVRKKNLPDELKTALSQHGRARDTEFQWLLPQGKDNLDDILVEIKRQPDVEEYRSYPIPLGR